MNDRERADYIEPKIAAALALLDSAVKQYQPKMVVGLMSGGDDSIPACYVASLHPSFSGILHVNTGIGIEATREHVRKVCADRKWKLWEYKASENTLADGTPDPMIYADIVAKHGFPGPAQHGAMYSVLKERQLCRFERDMDFDTRNPVLYISGARSQETRRRMLTVPSTVTSKSGRRAWCSVIHNWDKEDCGHARIYAGIPRNPASEHIGMSGECLCGAFEETHGLLELLDFWFPSTANEIRAIQRRVNAAGFPWSWEERPPKWFLHMRKGQVDFLATHVPPEMQHLCHSCNKQATDNGQLRNVEAEASGVNARSDSNPKEQ